MTWKVCCAAFLCGSLAAAIAVLSTAHACFVPREGDSRWFGNTLAAGDGYFAVGDSAANQVTLFRRTPTGRWSRWKTIDPPLGSEAAQAGSGFGSAIALDGTTLAIGARGTSRHVPSNAFNFETANPSDNLNPYLRNDRATGDEPADRRPGSYTGSVFTTSITENSLAPLQEILIPDR
ncbi:MAG: hypothetical protein AAF974_12015, partial [Cyanobacteria bacterium P01_E01_bin.34]